MPSPSKYAERKAAGLCTACGNEPSRPNGVVGERCAGKWNPVRQKLQQERRQQARQQAIEALGGKCLKCGFSDARALQIDHVHGGGRADRLRFGHEASIKFLEHVIACADSGDYQLLCANCNWIKRYEDKEYGGFVSTTIQ